MDIQETQNSKRVCRICYQGENIKHQGIQSIFKKESVEALIAPCQCTGSVAWVHASCLGKWLTVSKRRKCELCHFTYKTKKVPKKWSEFITDAEYSKETRNLIINIILVSLMIPLIIVNLYFAWYYASLQKHWPSCMMLSVGGFLLTVVVCLWRLIVTVYKNELWSVWKRQNQKTVLVANHSDQS